MEVQESILEDVGAVDYGSKWEKINIRILRS